MNNQSSTTSPAYRIDIFKTSLVGLARCVTLLPRLSVDGINGLLQILISADVSISSSIIYLRVELI
jgi:hypothetical protein